jgi:ubiquinone/menaquinone biosynthesis C-methylase UbiE
MDNEVIKNFWENNPCGQLFVCSNEKEIKNFRDFFLQYDKFRYSTEGHILANLDRIDFKNKKVLEIGIGQAADSACIIDRGAEYYGMDVTEESCKRAVLRFNIFRKPYKIVVCGAAQAIPFADNYFDIIYTHGVLHHIPDIGKVIPQLHRVLKNDGKLIAMVYAKNSLNYYVSILFLRRILLVGLWLLDIITKKRFIKNKLLRKHLENVKQFGLGRYLSTECFLSHNTDGPDNPYSRVYTKKDIAKVFNKFHFYAFRQYFLNERQLPFTKMLPGNLKKYLSSQLGWHLWCYGAKP